MEKRLRLPRQILDRKFEQRLARLRIPDRVTVTNHDAIAVGGDADRRERAAVRQLLAKPFEHALHFPLRDLRGRKLTRRPKDHQVLKPEPHFPAWPTLRLKKPLVCVGTNLRAGETQHRGDLADGE